MKLPNYRYLAGLVAVVIGMIAILSMPPTQQDIAGWILSITMQMATPLVLAGLGGMFSERGGVVNIGLEGMMIMGAFTGAAVAWYVGDWFLGVISACLAGGLLAAVHAVVCVKYKGNHIVSGTGVILFGSGFTTIMLELVWNQKGQGEIVTNTIPDIVIPQIQDAPFFGPAFSVISPVVIFMFVITAISWYVLYRTPFGLRLRAAGEDPSTLDSAGASVEWTRIIGVIISGCLAGHWIWFGICKRHDIWKRIHSTCSYDFWKLDSIRRFGSWVILWILGRIELFHPNLLPSTTTLCKLHCNASIRIGCRCSRNEKEKKG